MKEELKKAIRESLIYALTHSNIDRWSVIRNMVYDFYTALNRRKVLTNQEAEEEIQKVIDELEEAEINGLSLIPTFRLI